MSNKAASYRDDVVRDIWQRIEDGDVMDVQEAYDLTRGGFDCCDLADRLNDLFWCDDSVTGNGSGSYTFSSHDARELVLDRLDEVHAAYEEFGGLEKLGEDFANEEWEAMDVTARCHALYVACYDVAGEICDYIEEHADELAAKGLIELDEEAVAC